MTARVPTCHPSRPHKAKGLCGPCYYKERNSGGAQVAADTLDELRQELAEAKADLGAARERLAAFEPVGRPMGSVAVPKWAVPGPRSGPRTKPHHATPTLLLTDTHFGEVVRPEEIFRFNEYNSAVAERRLKYTFERAGVIVRRYMGGLDIDGIVVAMGGDMLTGFIHDELADTNDERAPETVVHFAPLIAAGLKALADEFGHVYAPAVSGNHDRNSQRKRHKRRAQDSWTWILYHWVRQLVAEDDRIEVDIAEGPDLTYKVYDTTYLLTHGDQFHGGTGISGVLSPLMLGQHRKTRRNAGLGQPYDIMVMGHWHQTLYLPGVFVGGTMKGYDEYAFAMNLPMDRAPGGARQSLWLTTPERGPTILSSVDCEPGGWRP